jgi:hypothetical protein
VRSDQDMMSNATDLKPFRLRRNLHSRYRTESLARLVRQMDSIGLVAMYTPDAPEWQVRGQIRRLDLSYLDECGETRNVISGHLPSQEVIIPFSVCSPTMLFMVARTWSSRFSIKLPRGLCAA